MDLIYLINLKRRQIMRGLGNHCLCNLAPRCCNHIRALKSLSNQITRVINPSNTSKATLSPRYNN